MVLVSYIKVPIDVNIQGIDRQQGAAPAYTSIISLRSREDTSKEESSANLMKIFIGLEDLQAKLPGLTMLDFFVYPDDCSLEAK